MFVEVPYTESTAHVLHVTTITGHVERRHCLIWLTLCYDDSSLFNVYSI